MSGQITKFIKPHTHYVVNGIRRFDRQFQFDDLDELVKVFERDRHIQVTFYNEYGAVGKLTIEPIPVTL